MVKEIMVGKYYRLKPNPVKRGWVSTMNKGWSEHPIQKCTKSSEIFSNGLQNLIFDKLKSLWDYYPANFEEVSNNEPTRVTAEDTKMTDIKTFNKKNLIKAKTKAQEEQKTYEIETAKKEYQRLIDLKDSQDRIVKIAKEELVKINEELKIFG